MRLSLSVFPVRRTSIPKRRKPQGASFSKMLGKLSAASDQLSRARRRR
jgi:hypothetical protein